MILENVYIFIYAETVCVRTVSFLLVFTRGLAVRVWGVITAYLKP